MAIVKAKDMPIFWVLSMFGGSYNSHRYNRRLTGLFQEINYKYRAVLVAFELILKQEKIIQKEQSEFKKTGVRLDMGAGGNFRSAPSDTTA